MPLIMLLMGRAMNCQSLIDGKLPPATAGGTDSMTTTATTMSVPAAVAAGLQCQYLSWDKYNYDCTF